MRRAASVSTPYADQDQAARNDAARILRRLHEQTGGQRVDGELGEISLKWRDEFTANVGADRVSVCEHVGSPIPVMLNAWSLDRMMCPSCNATYQLAHPDETNDFQCDGCGAHDPQMTPVVHQLGTVILVGGMCRNCVQIERATCGGIE